FASMAARHCRRARYSWMDSRASRSLPARHESPTPSRIERRLLERRTMSKKYDMTINGNTVPAGDYREIRNPANLDEIVGMMPLGGNDHLEQAIDAARSAFRSWRHSSD